MKAVDQSIVDVRQFLSKAEEIEKEQEQIEDTPIVSVMKLVDQGLVKLRGQANLNATRKRYLRNVGCTGNK